MASKSKKVIPSYPAELKSKLVELVRGGASIEALAEEYPPSAQTIRNWVAKTQPRPTPIGVTGDVGRLRDEVVRLRKVLQAKSMEVVALRQQIDMLAEEMPHRGIPASPFEVVGARTE